MFVVNMGLALNGHISLCAGTFVVRERVGRCQFLEGEH
jgi:hypothetical protein